MLLSKPMSRKEFLRWIAAVSGVFIVSRLSSITALDVSAATTTGSYGNEPYGGTKKK
jgi:hypothetical protein